MAPIGPGAKPGELAELAGLIGAGCGAGAIAPWPRGGSADCHTAFQGVGMAHKMTYVRAEGFSPKTEP